MMWRQCFREPVHQDTTKKSANTEIPVLARKLQIHKNNNTKKNWSLAQAKRDCVTRSILTKRDSTLALNLCISFELHSLLELFAKTGIIHTRPK